MDIYENFVIGSFLYGLGAAMAHRNLQREAPRTLVALTQQGPMDKDYGDLLIKTPGMYRIFEFKRQANREKKELAKLRILEEAIRCPIFTAEDVSLLQRVSREIHWYVEIPKDKTLADQVRVVPYLDFQALSSRIPLEDFVKETAFRASQSPNTQEEISEREFYLTVLCTCRGSDSAALVVLITAEGKVRTEIVPDIRDLIRPAEEVLKWQLRRELQLAEEWQRRLNRAHEYVKEYREQLELRHQTGRGRNQQIRHSHKIGF